MSSSRSDPRRYLKDVQSSLRRPNQQRQPNNADRSNERAQEILAKSSTETKAEYADIVARKTGGGRAKANEWLIRRDEQKRGGSGGSLRYKDGVYSQKPADKYFTTKYPEESSDAVDNVANATRVFTKTIDGYVKASKQQGKVGVMAVEMAGFVQQATQTITGLNNLVNIYGSGWQQVSDQLTRLSSNVDTKSTQAALDAIKKLSDEHSKKELLKFKESLEKIQKYIPANNSVLKEEQGLLGKIGNMFKMSDEIVKEDDKVVSPFPKK